MNYIDLLLAIIILSSVWTGWYRGFVYGVFDLVRWVGSMWLGLKFYQEVAVWLGNVTHWNEVLLLPLSFFLVALLASLVLQAIGNLLLAELPAEYHRHRGNRVMGLVPGFLSGVVTAAIVSVLFMAFPFSGTLVEETRESQIANKLATYTERAEGYLAPVFDQAIGRTMNNMTVAPSSDQTIQLPYKVANSKPAPQLEAEMLQLINEERAKEGLTPLVADTALRVVARLHSEDMFRRGYFSHYTPEGLSPFDRIKRHKVPFITAGENLAVAPTLEIAHEGLMNSPGHRANILRKQFRRVGIGIMKGGFHQVMITQNFRN